MTITVYADSNIYRYIANGELEITTVGSVRFAYSSVHFDEVLRGKNHDIIEGIRALNAVPLVSNENGEFDVESIGVCLDYEDPFDKFNAYKDNYVSLPEAEQSLDELLLRLFGADNLEMLKQVPDLFLGLGEEYGAYFDVESNDFQDKAEETASQLNDLLKGDLAERKPLAETRSEFGYPKGTTSLYKDDDSPIDRMWEKLEPVFGAVTKNQFFGFESIPNVDIERSRVGDVSGCHIVLNMLGYYPDKGLASRDKIRNILSDGQHAGYGSMCGCFLTSDYRLFQKAKAIFRYRNYSAQVGHVEYKPEGMSTVLVEPGAIKKYKLDPEDT